MSLDEKHTLHSKHPQRSGWISLVFLIGNIALQIYSHLGLSAVIKSSLAQGEELGVSLSACQNDTSYGDFKDYFENQGGAENYRFILGGEPDGQAEFEGCVLVVVFQGIESFRNCTRTDRISANGTLIPGVTGPDACIDCYALSGSCGVGCAFGTGNCFVDKFGESCSQCAEEQGCNAIFETCANATLPDNGRRLAHSRELQSEEDVELFNVYEISFVSSVRDSLNGEAYGIALVILLLSGIWPYAKNCIMFVAWFVPMTWKTRSFILKNLTRLAKWSLVDVFAIVIIIAGLRIDRQLQDGKRLVLVAESRIAIYTFCVAAIWDLVQGEWMRHMHLKAYEKASKENARNDDSSESRLLSDGSSLIEEVRFPGQPNRDCSSPGKRFTLAFMLMQLALCAASVFLVVINFTLFGDLFAEPSEIEYSAFTIATTILDEAALKVNDSIPGTVFLVIVYLSLSIVIPLFQFGAIIALTFVGWDKGCWNQSKYKAFFEAVDIIGGFACQDVFVLSFVVVTAEWDKMISSAISGFGGAACDPTIATCLAMTAETGIGIYTMTVALFLGWICEMFLSYAYSQLIHPVEKVPSIDAFFTVTSKLGCTRA